VKIKDISFQTLSLLTTGHYNKNQTQNIMIQVRNTTTSTQEETSPTI